MDIISYIIKTGTSVLNVRARASGGQTIVYGLDIPSGGEGVFAINSTTGNITVGLNGTSALVIQDHNPTMFTFDAYAYYLQSGPSGARVRTIIVAFTVTSLRYSI